MLLFFDSFLSSKKCNILEQPEPVEKNSKNFILEKCSGKLHFQPHHREIQSILNVSGCTRNAAFPTTLIARKKKPSEFKIQKQHEEDNIIKNIRHLFILKRINKAVKARIIRVIRNLFEKDDHYKPIKVGNFWNSNYIEYESNGDRSKSLSLEEYLNEIKIYLRDKKIDFQKSDTWKIQLKIAIKFISPKDTNEELVMHSKSDKIEVMTYDNANEVIEEIFESLISRYQIGLETLMKETNFLFDSVQPL